MAYVWFHSFQSKSNGKIKNNNDEIERAATTHYESKSAAMQARKRVEHNDIDALRAAIMQARAGVATTQARARAATTHRQKHKQWLERERP